MATQSGRRDTGKRLPSVHGKVALLYVGATLHATFLNTEQAAEFLAVSISTLEKWRTRGCGPTYVRIGRLVRYRIEALSAYVQMRTVSSQVDERGDLA